MENKCKINGFTIKDNGDGFDELNKGDFANLNLKKGWIKSQIKKVAKELVDFLI